MLLLKLGRFEILSKMDLKTETLIFGVIFCIFHTKNLKTKKVWEENYIFFRLPQSPFGKVSLNLKNWEPLILIATDWLTPHSILEMNRRRGKYWACRPRQCNRLPPTTASPALAPACRWSARWAWAAASPVMSSPRPASLGPWLAACQQLFR